MNTRRKKIIILTSRFPYPLEKGDKLRAYHQIEQLSKVVDVHLISLSTTTVSEEDKIAVSKICSSFSIYKLSLIARILGLLRAAFNNLPFQVNYLYSRRVKNKIASEIYTLRPDHIYCQLIRCTEYVKNIHYCSKSLDYMDTFSKGFERRIETTPFLLKWLFRNEAKRLRSYESRIFHYFDLHTIISHQDRNYIMHPEQNKIVVVPNGISENFLHPLNVKRQYDLVFVGNLSYAPNVEAVEFLAETLKNSTLTCLIAGATPSSRVANVVSKNPNLSMSGWVDDIRTAYCSANIFIAPMFIGTGMQNKLLEAMALGIPCITTKLAAIPVGGIHENNMLIAETKSEFLSAIERIAKDDHLRTKLIQNAKLLISEKYTWEKTSETFLQSILRNHS